MGTLISVLLIVVSVLLILIVLIQDSKGGGLSSTFGASNQVMGVRKTADFLEKATWFLAIALLVLCLATTPFSKTTAAGTDTGTSESVTRKNASEKGITAPPVAPAGGQQIGVPQAPTANPK